jgi:hypothetical protein
MIDPDCIILKTKSIVTQWTIACCRILKKKMKVISPIKPVLRKSTYHIWAPMEAMNSINY